MPGVAPPSIHPSLPPSPAPAGPPLSSRAGLERRGEAAPALGLRAGSPAGAPTGAAPAPLCPTELTCPAGAGPEQQRKSRPIIIFCFLNKCSLFHFFLQFFPPRLRIWNSCKLSHHRTRRGQNMEAKGEREPWKGARNPGGPEAGDTAALSTKCCPQMGLLQLASVRSIFSPN